MKRFEYRITRHAEDEFRKLVFFCSGRGECNADQIPAGQMTALGDILNRMGEEGWELVQLDFGQGGVVAVWKRPKKF